MKATTVIHSCSMNADVAAIIYGTERYSPKLLKIPQLIEFMSREPITQRRTHCLLMTSPVRHIKKQGLDKFYCFYGQYRHIAAMCRPTVRQRINWEIVDWKVAAIFFLIAVIVGGYLKNKQELAGQVANSEKKLSDIVKQKDTEIEQLQSTVQSKDRQIAELQRKAIKKIKQLKRVTTDQERDVVTLEIDRRQLHRDLGNKQNTVHDLRSTMSSRDLKIQEVQTLLFSKEQDIGRLQMDVGHLQFLVENQEIMLTDQSQQNRTCQNEKMQLQNYIDSKCRTGWIEGTLRGIGRFADGILNTGPSSLMVE